MTEAQQRELIGLVEGLVVGRMVEAVQVNHGHPSIPRETIKRISHNAAAYLAGQLREEFSK
jgi:hypothetical protein